jgi:hypothetical protein
MTSPGRKSIDYRGLANGPECNDRTIHGKWLSETTRPLGRLSEAKFLRNFYQYWLECGGREAKDPLKKTLQALRQATMAGIESMRRWTGKLMQHVATTKGSSSTEHEYLWREFESAIHEGRELKWEEVQKLLETKQDAQMKISTIKVKPPWKGRL